MHRGLDGRRGGCARRGRGHVWSCAAHGEGGGPGGEGAGQHERTTVVLVAVRANTAARPLSVADECNSSTIPSIHMLGLLVVTQPAGDCLEFDGSTEVRCILGEGLPEILISRMPDGQLRRVEQLRRQGLDAMNYAALETPSLLLIRKSAHPESITSANLRDVMSEAVMLLRRSV